MINYLGKYRQHVKYIPSYRNKACVAILEMNFLGIIKLDSFLIY